jgi:hypothetical protein
MIVTGENISARTETCPSATFSAQILRGLAWDRTRAALVSGRQITPFTAHWIRFEIVTTVIFKPYLDKFHVSKSKVFCIIQGVFVFVPVAA